MKIPLIAACTLSLSACISTGNQIDNEKIMNKPMALITHDYPPGQIKLPNEEKPLIFIITSNATGTGPAIEGKSECFTFWGKVSLGPTSAAISFPDLEFRRDFTCSTPTENNLQIYVYHLLRNVKSFTINNSTGKIRLMDSQGRNTLWLQFLPTENNKQATNP